MLCGRLELIPLKSLLMYKVGGEEEMEQGTARFRVNHMPEKCVKLCLEQHRRKQKKCPHG